MRLNFREWVIKEASELSPEQLQMFGLKPGDAIDPSAVNLKYRKLARQFHPDRAGDDTKMRLVNDAIEKLRELIKTGQIVPAIRGQHYQTWRPPQRNVVQEYQNDIKSEINKAIKALRTTKQSGQPSYMVDALASISHLVDPNTGKLNHPVPGYTVKPLLKSSLEQWVKQYNDKFYDNLEVILTTALQFV